MTEVKIPSLGESITSGVIAGWQVANGAYVNAGQTLFELETDKITQELQAETSGIIAIKAQEGDEVEIGAVVATIDESASAPSGTSAPSAPPSENQSRTEPSADNPQSAKSGSGETVAIKIPALGESISSGILNWSVQNGQAVASGETLAELETDKITQELAAEADGVVALRAEDGAEVAIGQVVATIAIGAGAPRADTTPSTSAANGAALPLSPAARRVATENGIDPTTVPGSGKGGRVTKGDLLAAAQQKSANGDAAARSAAAKRMDPDQVAASRPPFPTSKPAIPAAAPQATGDRTTRKRMSPLRKKIAERLVNATVEAALLTTFNEVDMSAVMGLRKRYQEAFVEKHGIKLGFMSFFVKAAVEALKEVPGINAQIDGDDIVQNHYYDIGVAVGTDKGLIVPVVRDCDSKSFAGIEQAIIDKAKAARAGKLTLDDLQGGVFTISNGGIYGSMLSTPLLNMPQSGILGLHNIQDRPMAVNGEVVIRPMMYLALSYDHRLVDGKEAVTFLVKVKQLIEAPERLLFGI